MQTDKATRVSVSFTLELVAAPTLPGWLTMLGQSIQEQSSGHTHHDTAPKVEVSQLNAESQDCQNGRLLKNKETTVVVRVIAFKLEFYTD